MRTRPLAAVLACALAWASGARAQEADLPPPVQRPSVARMASDQAAQLVLAALNFLDTPYRPGGNGGGDQGFDCSGFTRHVFALSGLVLPRRADEQARARGLVEVPHDALQPGDLVFFDTLASTFSHVGIYLGNGRFIHAPRPGRAVRVEDMTVRYWARRFTGARRAAAFPSPVNP
jgi:cell wall-associated NlpC family hydrolase